MSLMPIVFVTTVVCRTTTVVLENTVFVIEKYDVGDIFCNNREQCCSGPARAAHCEQMDIRPTYLCRWKIRSLSLFS